MDIQNDELENIPTEIMPTPENPNYIIQAPYPAANWIAPQLSTPQTPRASPHLYAWPTYFQPAFNTPTSATTSTERAPESDGERSKNQTDTPKRAWRTVQEKVEEVLALLNSYSWTLGDLLWYIFAMQDKNGKKFEPSLRHYQIVAKFLTGETNISVSKILELWIKSPYGLPPESNEERTMLFSTKIDYQSIKYARPAITSFSAQIVRDELVSEVKKAARRDAGLHTFTSSKGKEVSRYDLGAQTFPNAKEIFKTKMPTMWQYLLLMSMPNEESITRERRPPEYVVTEALSMIVYSRNMYAKVVALDKGILNFASCANKYIFYYDSRMGIAPSYHAVYEALIKLANHDAEIIRNITTSRTSALLLRLDNVQHYVRPRNFRVGREATMKIGTAGTVFGFLDYSRAAVDLVKKSEKLAEEQRKDFTFGKLLERIDTDHISGVCAVQWLRVLINFIPWLSSYKGGVKKLYETKYTKKRLPPRKTQIFPLPTNGHNETVTAELLKAVLDFVKEMGYTEDSPPDQLIHVGGDGLTYERLVLLKWYMQFHDTSFQRLEWLQPFLETWHASWTDLSRIYEAHWDSLLTDDPSSIGHSANQIRRKAPANLKKVDYYPYSELAYQVLDARILDCWRIYLCGNDGDLLEYFKKAHEKKTLPSFESLHDTAQILFRRYGHPYAFEDALSGTYHEPETTVPSGDSWSTPTREESSMILQDDRKKGKNKPTRSKKKTPSDADDQPLPPPFQGDMSLAQSCRFLYDATVSREVIYATADGDVGRVWESLKSMILTFAGSTHTKYTNYLLEMLCDLELESSDELREAFLVNWLINPSGQEGRFIAGDKFQEQLQDEMYEHIGRKDRGFDENYMRQVIAPNAYRFVLVKKAVTEGLGLAKRGGKHIEPHTNPETIKLLQVYQKYQLHMFRSGRNYGGDLRKADDLGRGQTRLAEGKLASWVQETTRARRLNTSTNQATIIVTEIESELEQLDKEIEVERMQQVEEARTPGHILFSPDGELIFQVDDENDAMAWEAEEEDGLEDYGNHEDVQ